MREAPKFGQCQIEQIVHRTSQCRFRLADEMAQGDQMRQTRNTTSPNRLSTTVVPHLNKPQQVPHKGIGETVQGKNQLVARFSLDVRPMLDI